MHASGWKWGGGILLFFAVGFAADDGGLSYRVSFRKQSTQPWTFYADVPSLEHAERIGKKLNSIGYKAQISPITAGEPPAVSPPPAPSAPAPLPDWFTNPKAQPTVKAGNTYFTPGKVVADSDRPGYRSSVFAVGNSSITSRWNPWIYAGGGIGVNLPINPMAGPHLNSITPGISATPKRAPGHPTPAP